MMVFMIIVNVAWPYGSSDESGRSYSYPGGISRSWMGVNGMENCQKFAARMTDTNRLAYCVGPQFK